MAGMVGGKCMKILAVSDTHGDRDILAAILKQQPNLDGYFYAGDSELPANDPLFKIYRAVAGNIDLIRIFHDRYSNY